MKCRVPSSRRALAGLIFAAAVCVGPRVQADVRLPALFSDHMVLQCDAPVPIWGWADAGEKITVRIAGQEKTTAADGSGKWSVTLDELSGEQTQTLVVTGRSVVTVEDVLIGEVWLCSGQSNMGVPLSAAVNGEQEVAAAKYPQLRMFAVAPHGSLEPEAEVKGKWEVCSPQTAAHWTAVGYFFGRELHQQLKVPVGLIYSSVGGTPIEGWMRREALDSIPELRKATDDGLRRMQSQPEDIRQFPQRRDAWEKRFHVQAPPNAGFAKDWAHPDFDDRDWKTVAMPARWSQAAGVKSGGVFWLRKAVTFPPALAGQPFTMNFNFMHDQYNTAYFNGVEVGHSGDEPPLFNMSQRRYDVPGQLVKAGKNVIALRIVSASPQSELLQRGANGDYALPIHRRVVGNQWRLKVESLFDPLPPEALATRPRPNEAALYNTPVILWNAMIRPLIPYRIRGAIWYQGESNTSRPAAYHQLFPLLIEDWRRQWGEGEFPFYFVQLANYLQPPADPNAPSRWAALREAQTRTLEKTPCTGMAVAIDIGEGDNIHPINKQDVGRRLALAALAKTYGRSIEFSGPEFQSMAVEGNRIRIRFAHAEGLVAKEGPPKWFAIAGQDRKFVWASATVEGTSVLVSAPQVTEPVAVRYAWADNPEGVNLYNAAGLPAGPFRTDHW